MKKGILLLASMFLNIAAFCQLTAEQKKIKQTFTDFLHFYEKHAEKFNSFELYKGTGKNNNPPFKIQWKEVEKYFAYLRKSVPYVGEAYIKAEKAHFKYSDSCFKADPQDEIAAGFDYDRWGGGQDGVDYLVKYHTSSKNIYKVDIKGNKATLRIGGELYEGAEEKDRSWSVVPFVKEKGKWVMADNIYPEEVAEEVK